MNRKSALAQIQREVVACERCSRLIAHCRKVATEKRRAYLDWNYWGKPVPSLGDPNARLLIVGLAPGAHGANRTGRMFTGDGSGDFLYRVLYETGFASQPEATHQGDGLQLIDCYITAPVRCAPPDNKPTRSEFAACQPYLEREVKLFSEAKVVVALGRLALDSYLGVLLKEGSIKRRADYPFAHAACHRSADCLPTLLCSYHPSRQNTQTGRLTKEMMLEVFRTARSLLS